MCGSEGYYTRQKDLVSTSAKLNREVKKGLGLIAIFCYWEVLFQLSSPRHFMHSACIQHTSVFRYIAVAGKDGLPFLTNQINK